MEICGVDLQQHHRPSPAEPSLISSRTIVEWRRSPAEPSSISKSSNIVDLQQQQQRRSPSLDFDLLSSPRWENKAGGACKRAN
ncbi:hypothetical protein L6452_36865 [Arctium lappa]|uniref:Uncharacterized protein n=1 Tax=Arctium lappa TaxID=4217 RepID=A0ACB8Y2J9_ARCLA|nr:hypothetical protein L6452_36865 [Arctium lappa]